MTSYWKCFITAKAAFTRWSEHTEWQTFLNHIWTSS